MKIEVWADIVRGIDGIVNAAGLLRGPDMDAVHVEMVAFLTPITGSPPARSASIQPGIVAKASNNPINTRMFA